MDGNNIPTAQCIIFISFRVCARRRARWPLPFRAEKSWRYFGRFLVNFRESGVLDIIRTFISNPGNFGSKFILHILVNYDGYVVLNRAGAALPQTCSFHQWREGSLFAVWVLEYFSSGHCSQTHSPIELVTYWTIPAHDLRIIIIYYDSNGNHLWCPMTGNLWVHRNILDSTRELLLSYLQYYMPNRSCLSQSHLYHSFW